MANKKHDDQNGSSQNSVGSKSGREFESQGQDSDSQGEGQRQAGLAGGYGRDTGAQGKVDDDDMDTAGGREGTFSESQRGKDGQWSPGSTQSSDQ